MEYQAVQLLVGDEQESRTRGKEALQVKMEGQQKSLAADKSLSRVQPDSLQAVVSCGMASSSWGHP